MYTGESTNVKEAKLKIDQKKCQRRKVGLTSNGNASETKANEIFDNSVFFDIGAKRTPSLERKLFSKRSEHIR